MRYRIRHTTKYAYTDPVAVCHNLVRLAPRHGGAQRVESYRLLIAPEPSDRASRVDLFGNTVEYFSIQDAHRALSLSALSEVEVKEVTPEPGDESPAWDALRDRLIGERSDLVDEFRFTFPSQHVPLDPRLREYAAPSFPAGRDLVGALEEFTERIHDDFEYQSGSTSISTTVLESLDRRVGVCQDFAHFGVACLRTLGLSARYVSGYLRTEPPPGKERLVGADESHAWYSVWCGDAGWLDFDPTNNCRPTTDHVTIAWGRDYADICPIQGVVVGGGTPALDVSVDVAPVDAEQE